MMTSTAAAGSGSELTELSASSIAAKLDAGEVTSVEVVQAHVDRIAAVDPTVRAFLHVDADGALAAARQADEDRAAGRVASPLAGVPLALKDVLTTRDRPTTCGSKMLEGWTPPYDAAVTNGLR